MRIEISFLLVQLILIILKLSNVLRVSWFIILIPAFLYIWIVIMLILIAIFVISILYLGGRYEKI